MPRYALMWLCDSWWVICSSHHLFLGLRDVVPVKSSYFTLPRLGVRVAHWLEHPARYGVREFKVRFFLSLLLFLSCYISIKTLFKTSPENDTCQKNPLLCDSADENETLVSEHRTTGTSKQLSIKQANFLKGSQCGCHTWGLHAWLYSGDSPARRAG